MAKLMNLARMSTATTGTGTITLGSAVSGCLTFAQAAAAAGVSSGDTITYGIEDGAQSEVGRGVWNSGAGTLTRAQILASTNAGSAINLSGTAEVFCIAAAEDIGFRGAMVKKSADQTGANYTAGVNIAWDQESYDVGGWHDNVTNNTRLTVPAGVNYVQVGANVVIANQNVDTWSALILSKNGSNVFDGASAHRSEVGSLSPNLSICSGPIAVVAGDYFEVILSTESDTSIDITANRSNFWIRAIG